jgi:hypothetical protein
MVIGKLRRYVALARLWRETASVIRSDSHRNNQTDAHFGPARPAGCRLGHISIRQQPVDNVCCAPAVRIVQS